MVLMSLPLGYFFAFHLDMGLVGIWLAIAIDEWTRAIIMFFRWKSRWDVMHLLNLKNKRRLFLFRCNNTRLIKA